MAMKSFRVVYAEDDDMVRATIAQIMVAHGLDVHECSNGGEAALLCEVFRPDAVVLDLSMPGVDGCEAGGRTREKQAGPGRAELKASAWQGPRSCGMARPSGRWRSSGGGLVGYHGFRLRRRSRDDAD